MSYVHVMVQYLVIHNVLNIEWNCKLQEKDHSEWIWLLTSQLSDDGAVVKTE